MLLRVTCLSLCVFVEGLLLYDCSSSVCVCLFCCLYVLCVPVFLCCFQLCVSPCVCCCFVPLVLFVCYFVLHSCAYAADSYCAVVVCCFFVCSMFVLVGCICLLGLFVLVCLFVCCGPVSVLCDVLGVLFSACLCYAFLCECVVACVVGGVCVLRVRFVCLCVFLFFAMNVFLCCFLLWLCCGYCVVFVLLHVPMRCACVMFFCLLCVLCCL